MKSYTIAGGGLRTSIQTGHLYLIETPDGERIQLRANRLGNSELVWFRAENGTEYGFNLHLLNASKIIEITEETI